MSGERHMLDVRREADRAIHFDFSTEPNKYELTARHGFPPCPQCKRYSVVTLNGTQYHRFWVQGQHVQTVFPELGAAERELLITGVHPECWDAYIGADDELKGPDDEDFVARPALGRTNPYSTGAT